MSNDEVTDSSGADDGVPDSMSNDERSIIDAEIVESDCLPAVVEQQEWSSEGLDTVTRRNGKTYTAKAGRTAEGLSLDEAEVAKYNERLANNPERVCAGTTSKGVRCRRFAIAGSTVCRHHGGATRHVVAKARVRVENASNKLMGKLIEFAFDDTKPPDVQLRAMRDALDRAGLRAPSEVVLSQGEPKAYETVFDSIGGTPPAEWPSVASATDSAGVDQALSRQGCAQSDSQTLDSEWLPESDDMPQPRRGEDIPPEVHCHIESEHDDPPESCSPPHPDREREPQAPERHITGEAAMRLANQANLASGAMKAIESPHKGYRRP